MSYKTTTNKIIIALIILTMIFAVSCTMVRYRQFQGEEKYYKATGEWKIGTPMVIALPGISDKKLWSDHYYWAEIPVRYNNENLNAKAEHFMNNGFIRIDTIYIYPYIYDTCYIKSLVTFDDGTPVFAYLQQYDHSPVSFAFDTLTIPQDEDSIRIDFTVKIRDTLDSNITETPFSFVLYRYDKKKLGIWGGK